MTIKAVSNASDKSFEKSSSFVRLLDVSYTSFDVQKALCCSFYVLV